VARPRPSPLRRAFVATLASAAFAATGLPARAQDTAIRFQLDWQFDGPSALFVTPAARGYFKNEKLNVTLDPGNGSAGTVLRVASGSYDMGFADLAALMEFHANNPAATNKPVAVMMVYNNTPAAVMAMKKSGIESPADLSGKKLGAPAFDAGRRAWPIFAKVNGIEGVTWMSMEAPLREAMLMRGEVDAITGYAFTSMLELETRGAQPDDIVLLPFAQYGVKLYGNVIIVGEDFLKKRPEAVKAFLRAFARGMKDVMLDPKSAVGFVKQRNGALNEAVEQRRLKLALELAVLTADARADGFGDVNGSRLSLMASQVSDAFGTRERVNPNAVWNGSLLPRASDRNIFAARH
jgi:NitT/TauT family transport system substrate-binding protein